MVYIKCTIILNKLNIINYYLGMGGTMGGALGFTGVNALGRVGFGILEWRGGGSGGIPGKPTWHVIICFRGVWSDIIPGKEGGKVGLKGICGGNKDGGGGGGRGGGLVPAVRDGSSGL